MGVVGLVESMEPGFTGVRVEIDGVGVEGVGGPAVGGLLDSEMSPPVSMATALRRSTEAVSSRPLRVILKVSRILNALDRKLRMEVEVDGVPGHMAERRGSTSSTEGSYTLMNWRYVGAEVVGCGRMFGVDAANRLRHPVWMVLCTPKILREA